MSWKIMEDHGSHGFFRFFNTLSIPRILHGLKVDLL
jgi:hypothetical protein